MANMEARHSHFVAEFVKQGTVKGASKACKVSAATGYRWLQAADVRKAVRDAREQRFFELTTKLGAIDSDTVQVIVDIMHDKEVNEQTRLQAAMFLLKLSIDRYDVDDLQARIEKLEVLTSND